MIKYPDYDRSILSIAASVLKYFGVTDCEHKTLPEFDELLNKKYKNNMRVNNDKPNKIDLKKLFLFGVIIFFNCLLSLFFSKINGITKNKIALIIDFIK